MKKLVIDHSILRLISIMIGGFSIFLGYQLFIKGITGKASLVVNANTLGGQLLNAAPGLFFAIAGVIIVIFGLLRKETVMLSGGANDTRAPEKIEILLEKILEDASFSHADKQIILNALIKYEEHGSIPTYLRRQVE